MRYTHRIRRCEGNKKAWLLIALNERGEEIDSYHAYTTAMTLDALLKHSRGLLPGQDDVVQIVYYADADD